MPAKRPLIRPKVAGAKTPRPKVAGANRPSAKTPNSDKLKAGKPRAKTANADRPGFAPRAAAMHAVGALGDGTYSVNQLIDQWTTSAETDGRPLTGRDRALAHQIALTWARRRRQIDAILQQIFERALPKRAVKLPAILRMAIAELLFMHSADHAVVSIAVDLAKQDRYTRHYHGLINASLRRIARERDYWQNFSEGVNNPAWLWQSWVETYGIDHAHKIAQAHLEIPAIDISTKSNAAHWAHMLGGELLPWGSIRLSHSGKITDLPGFHDGEWWVQDAASALPARLLFPCDGMKIVDLCAAPGGKTAQLLVAGAQVTALDVDSDRLGRLAENLRRLGLSATLVHADACLWAPDHLVDAVLIDAPCSATGIIRRHPDISWQRRPSDLEHLCRLQRKLMAQAAGYIRPGGHLLYVTCSLQPEECTEIVADFIETHPNYRRQPISAQEIGAPVDAISPEGDLRTLPFMQAGALPHMRGMDGFYAARLVRSDS